MTRSRQWIVLSALLVAIGCLTFAYKVVRLGYPVLPDQTSEQWVVQARLEVEPVKGPVRASLLLPVRATGFTISNESFVSREFGLTVEDDPFRRQADWAGPTDSQNNRVTIIADARHQTQLAPITNGSRKVR